MVSAYLQGGDLMMHLIRKGTFNLWEAKFYTASLCLAVDYVHEKLGYVHRDIKPDNVVFDSRGQLYLLDFGLCKCHPSAAVGYDADGSNSGDAHEPLLHSVVGTPDYMAPELYYRARSSSQASAASGSASGRGGESNKRDVRVPSRATGYGRGVDIWSIGVILFEMLYGGPPFSDEKHNPKATAARVQRFREFLYVPPLTHRHLDDGMNNNKQQAQVQAQLPQQHPGAHHQPTSMNQRSGAVSAADARLQQQDALCRDLLYRLICEPKTRATIVEVKRHGFFAPEVRFFDARWLRNQVAPFFAQGDIRATSSKLDTSNFDKYDDPFRTFQQQLHDGIRASRFVQPNQHALAGYSYTSIVVN